MVSMFRLSSCGRPFIHPGQKPISQHLIARNGLGQTLPITLRRLASKAAKTTPKAPLRAGKSVKAPASNAYKPFAQTFAERKTPTLLYQASSHTSYMLGCYSVGIVLIVWAAHTTNQMWHYPPIKFASYLKAMFYGICTVSAGMAVIFFKRVRRKPN